MKTDPTTSVTGVNGLPLAYETVQTGRDAANNRRVSAKPKEAISDTLETTDREGDGRQILDVSLGSGHSETEQPEHQDRLDLTG